MQAKIDIITANSNPKVKALNKLNKDSSVRRERNVYIVEGIRMFREIPKEDIEEIYLSESAYRQGGLDLDMDKVTVFSDSVFSTVSQTKTPQGYMAVVSCRHYELSDVIAGGGVFLVLDRLQDPGNLGTIFRSAEAAGVKGIILGEGCCDPYNPKVVRSTMGAIFRVPFVSVPNLVDAIGEMKKGGIVTYGAYLGGENMYNMHFEKDIAFLIGNEGQGLSEEVLATADKLLLIPMEGQVESLNASISATLLAFEAMRQRSFS